MKNIFLVVLLLAGMASFSQSINKEEKGKEHRQLILNDSMVMKIQKFKDSAATAIRISDSIQTQENISRNVNGLLQLQKEQNARQKKAAIIRIAIGVALLVVLIIGWRRRRKK